MEYVFTIKVKTKPDNCNVFPSERRYSASTVAGLAWIHIVLAGICFVLACLAILHPVGGGVVTHLTTRDAVTSTVDRIEFVENVTMDGKNPYENVKINLTDNILKTADEYSCILVLAPSILTVASLAAGTAAIMASHHWYIDRNITWLFLMSILSTTVSIISFFMVIVWIVNVDATVLSRFYTDKEPFEDFIVIPKDSIIERNSSHIVIDNSIPVAGNKDYLVTKRVLSINILIACFIECVWSLLSLKISYKGMKNDYKDEAKEQKHRDSIKTMTVIKKIENPSRQTPDLIETHPKTNIKIVLNDEDHNKKVEKDTESDDRGHTMSYYNSSFDNDSNADTLPSLASVGESSLPADRPSRASTMSWGDSRDHTVYNQNNLDLARVMQEKINAKLDNECGENAVGEAEISENGAS